jgi:hypothetical protein
VLVKYVAGVMCSRRGILSPHSTTSLNQSKY